LSALIRSASPASCSSNSKTTRVGSTASRKTERDVKNRKYLCITGYREDQTDNGICRTDHKLPYDVEIDTELAANQRQNKDDPDQNHHAVWLDARERDRQRTREHANRNASAIERRQRQQVEDGEQDVDHQRVFEVLGNPWRRRIGQIDNQVKCQSG